MPGRRPILLLLGVAILALTAEAASAAGPLVAGFERFGRPVTDAAGRVEAGLLLLGELGCINCHAAGDSAAAHVATKTGPVLDDVGRRLAPEWLVRYVRDPHAVKPGTTMPDLLAGLPDAERDRTATALAHFLVSTGPFDASAFKDAEKANPREGLAVYERAGCAACHGSRRTGAAPLADQVPLVDIDAKWSPRSLEAFLANPLAVRPSGRMPSLPLKDQDRRHVAAALLGSLQAEADPHRDVHAFTGRGWRKRITSLSAFDSLGPPDRDGVAVKGFDMPAVAGAATNFAVQLHGYLHAPVAGVYQLHVASDDGSRVLVGEKIVVDNDGVHPDTEKTGSVELTAGVHPVRIDYFDAGGNVVLDLQISPPRGRRVSALAVVTPTREGRPALRPEDAVPSVDFAPDPALVEAGRASFATLGCAGCHQLKAAGRQPRPAPPAAAPLDRLARLDAGCLAQATGSGEPRVPAPRYGLDEPQRAAVTAAIAWLRSAAAEAKPDRERAIDRILTSLNCYACHTRAAPGMPAKGGVVPAVATVDDDGEPVLTEAARDALFTTAIQELGDEGRLPPTLTGVGDKLRPEFLAEVLGQGGKDRGTYMHTLMPKWHAAAASSLAALLGDDPKTEQPVPAIAGHDPLEVVSQGRHLVGSKALGCIKCHSFAGEKGQGQGVVDLVRMPKRLRHEWFLAYVANPQRFRPGTRMPAAWPEGKSFYPDVLDGTAPVQIEAVWRYLADAKPRPPIGAGNNPIELVPKERPIIYRNFIDGAGARAIGVGFPEQVHLAWDAELLRLALVWRGGFIDAGRHWTGRGQGFQPPLGDDVVAPEAAAAIETLAGPDAEWPAQPRQRGASFGGYTLDGAGRPTFLWSLDGMKVSESFEPVGGAQPAIRRTIRLAARPGGGTAFFRAAVATKIEEAGTDGWRRIDGQWRVRVTGSGVGAEARRVHDGRTELRYPIVWAADDTATIVEEISW